MRLAAPVFACAALACLPGCGGSPTKPDPVYPPPSLTCPADVSVTANPGQLAVVSYAMPAAVNGAPPVTVSCAPGSGSSFDLGTSQVACTATDAQSRSASCAFKVTVTAVPQIAKVKFLAFGDSVTSGTISSPCPATEAFDTLWMRMAVVAPESYPYKLQSLLAARYTSQSIDVVNEGKPGEKATVGVDRLPGVLAAAKPEVLLLLDGFNDLLNAGRRGTFDTTIPDIITALDTMVRMGKREHEAVMLATFPAQDPGGCRGQGAPGVERLNEGIRKVAADEDIVLVDLYNGLGASPTGVIGIDGLHPTEEGYTKMARVWYDAIREAFEQPSATGVPGPILVPRVKDRIP